MTLILTINGPDSIWMLADRRLSSRGRPPVDDACKVMLLETIDATAILGYAGLGRTVGGIEPSKWMSAVLRGRNLPLEQSLQVLSDALRRQLPRHMLKLPGPGPTHNLLVTALRKGKPHFYSIDLSYSGDRGSLWGRHTRWYVDENGNDTGRTPRFALAGSGLRHLYGKQQWTRPLLHLLRASDAQKISQGCVADHLAALNHRIHLQDSTVGPRCIVVWRNRKGGPHKAGGEHRFYAGTSRDKAGDPALPQISRGQDMQGIANAMMSILVGHMKSVAQPREAPAFPADFIDQVREAFERLPNTPDETLR